MKTDMSIYYQLVPVPRFQLVVPCSWLVPRGKGHAQVPLIHGGRAEGKHILLCPSPWHILWKKPQKREYFYASLLTFKTTTTTKKERAECMAESLPWEAYTGLFLATAQVALWECIRRVNHCTSKRRCRDECNWKLAGLGSIKSCVNFKCCSSTRLNSQRWGSDLCLWGLLAKGSYCLDAYQGLLSILSFQTEQKLLHQHVSTNRSLSAAEDRNVKQPVRNRNQSYIQSCLHESLAQNDL